jgi:hypothetical protein
MDTLSNLSAGQSRARPLAATLPVFAGTLFLSSFLLFGIQPMFAKMVLPKLGGSPGVWSVAMVFFQTVLLAGYGYAHWLVSRFDVRRGALIHVVVMAVVLLAALPIGIGAGFERPPQDGQILWLVLLFSASVGLPFFAVAANAPLLQAWFARSGHAHAGDPYFLYAASNIGSFLALIAYPFLVEPFLTLSMQASSWTWGFGLLLAGIAACAGASLHGTAMVGAAPIVERTVIPLQRKLVWVGYAFIPSGLLVAVTAHISTDIAAAPLLWVAPLALFLLTFVIVFQRRPLLAHRWMQHAQLVLVVALIANLFVSSSNWVVALLLHLALFFVTAMVSHGELARRRPAAADLTQFYFWMSVGGVLGGLFSGLLAPVLFNSILEYPLLLLASLVIRIDFRTTLISRPFKIVCAGLGALILLILLGQAQQRTDTVRSFFGVHRIVETADGNIRQLVHGSTIHGAQRLRNPDGTPTTGRPEPLTYYFRGGGIVDGIDAVRAVRGGRLDAVSVIGMGTGSLACQVRTKEAWTFYEIDPLVVRIATDPARFSFVSECAPHAPIVLGDARLTLADARDGSLDLIVVDAFSSDAIPVHLLTTEAISLYRAKLRPDGVVLFHISNRNMELGAVVTATAHAEGLTTWLRAPKPTPELLAELKSSPYVAVVAKRAEDVSLDAGQGWVRQEAPGPARAWCDDYADIVGAIWRMLRR